MAPAPSTDRPIQLRKDRSDDEYLSDESDAGSTNLSDSEHNDGSMSEDDISADAESAGSPENIDERSIAPSSDESESDLKHISFGALAKAQESLAPPSKSRKRKLPSAQLSEDQEPATIDNPHPTRENLSKKPKQDLIGRTSKHAPAILSSRNPVSRKRDVFSPPPAQKSRDPRFDPAITSRTLNTNAISQASKAYSFLTEYQASEILALKSEIKKSQTSDPAHATELKKQVMSMEARLRNAETKRKEQEILRKHRTQEKHAIREGKKSQPYFLKKSELKREIEKERVDGMGKAQLEKKEKRKRMREKRKEARDMPWTRRTG